MIPNTGLPNTARRKRVIDYLREGLVPADIARLEGVTHQHIYRLIRQMGIVKETRWKETQK